MLSVMRRIVKLPLLLFALFIVGCQEEALLHDLTEIQANRVIVALDKVAIHAEKVHDGQSWSIVTKPAQVTAALAALEESRVLRDGINNSSTGSASSLVQSREERMQLVERQLAGSLESTLETLPDVLQARVHLFLDVGDKLSLLPNPPKQTASVLIITDRAESIERGQIQKLVSGASGVLADQVTVLVSASKDTAPKLPSESASSVSAVAAHPTVERIPSQSSSGVGQRWQLPAGNVLGLVIVATFVAVGFVSVFVIRRQGRKRLRDTKLRPPAIAPDAMLKEPVLGPSNLDKESVAGALLNGTGSHLADEVF